MKRIAAGVAAWCLLLGGIGSGVSYAGYIENGDGATEEYAVAIGEQAQASAKGAFAVGRKVKATQQYAVAMGWGAQASGIYSFAIGVDSIASGYGSVAMGADTKATGQYAVAMGRKSTAGGFGAMAMGDATNAAGQFALTAGIKSQAMSDNSVAFSGGTVEAGGTGSMAVGVGAKASLSDTLALGSYALANVAKGQKGYLAGDDTSVAFVSTGNAIAIGGGTDGSGAVITRQLTGLAAGTADTDAVNVAQLKKAVAGAGGSGTTYTAGKNITISAANEISAKDTTLDDTSTGLTLEGNTLKLSVKDTDGKEITKSVDLSGFAGGGAGGAVHYYSANSTKTGAGTNYDNDGAKGEGSVVLGISSTAEATDSTVIGSNNTLASGSGNIVAGQNLTVDGVRNSVFATDYSLFGKSAATHVSGEQNVVIGGGNLVGYTAAADPNDPTQMIYTKVGPKGSDQNLAVGTLNTVNGGSMVFGKGNTANGTALILGVNSQAKEYGISIGNKNQVLGTADGGGWNGIALGNDLTVKGEQAVAIGKQSQAVGNRTVVIGSQATTAKTYDVAMGYQAAASGGQSMALGAVSKAAGANSVAFGSYANSTVNNGVALGSFSVANTAKGVQGYDPSTGAVSTDETHVWKSVLGAVSVGDLDKKRTRQITGVAAGTADTDAVNVAQLKKAMEGVGGAGGTTYTAGKNITISGTEISAKDTTLDDTSTGLTLEGNTLKLSVKDTDGKEITKSVDLSGFAGGGAGGAVQYFSVNSAVPENMNNDGATGDDSMAIGPNAAASGDWTTAVGGGTSAEVFGSVAMGYLAHATNEVATALGYNSGAAGEEATAVGVNSVAAEIGSVAMGAEAKANGAWSTTVGAYSVADGKDSSSLGRLAQATVDSGVALGSYSVAEREAGALGWNPINKAAFDLDAIAAAQGKTDEFNRVKAALPGLKSALEEAEAAYRADSADSDKEAAFNKAQANYNEAVKEYTAIVGTYQSGFGAVSVGSDLGTRQITNVAAGTEDTDAVNVGQLKALATQMENGTVQYFSVNSTADGNKDNAGATGKDSIAIGGAAKATNTFAIAIGEEALADSVNTIAVGRQVKAPGQNAIAIGANSESTEYDTVAIGDHAKATGEKAIAMGGYAEATDELAAAFGDHAKASGISSTALGASSAAEELGAVALGSQAKATGEFATALGSFSVADKASTVAIGSGAYASGDWAVALGGIAQVTVDDGVALGAKSVADREAGALGWDPTSGQVFADADAIAASLGKTDEFNTVKAALPGLKTALDEAQAAYEADASDPENQEALSEARTNYDAAVREYNAIVGAYQSGYGAVSVGSDMGTRQITNVAAGTEDTDAVNVGQLKKALAGVAGGNGTTYTAGDNITISAANEISAKDTTLDENSTGLTLEGNTLKLSVKDTDGKEITKSVDLSGFAGGGQADGNDTLVSTSDALSVKDGNLNLSFEDTAGNTVTGSVKLSDLAAGADTRNTVKAGDHVSLKEEANVDGSSTYTVSVKTDGKVAKDDTGIVTGGAVYAETRVEQDGAYVKAANTAGQNLTALDNRMSTLNSQVGNLSNQMNSLNGRVDDLADRINHVGAGAAALAALHPQDYDPAAKLDFAAGYGHYNGANAVAIGAFYRPNNTTMFSIGGSMGGGENMVNVGVSIKVGESGAYTGYSKAAMATVIEAQNDTIAKQQAQIEDILRQLEEMKK